MVKKKKAGSNFWKGIRESWDIFRKNVSWRVGNGKMINFWNDSWVPNIGPLALQVTGNAGYLDVNKTLQDFVVGNQWNLQQFSNMLPRNIVNKIKAMVTPEPENIDDSIAWMHANDGDLSLASAYGALSNHGSRANKKLFLVIWRWNDRERIRILLWKVAHEILLTNDKRLARGFCSSGMCSVCSSHVENHFHVFRDCDFAKEVWIIVSGSGMQGFFSQQNWVQWLYDNLVTVDDVQGATWNTTFAVVLDNLWRRRNDISILNNNLWSHDEIVFRVRRSVMPIKEVMVLDDRLNMDKPNRDRDAGIRWKCPSVGKVALNCDGSVINEGSKASCGGVLQDSMCSFVTSFVAIVTHN